LAFKKIVQIELASEARMTDKINVEELPEFDFAEQLRDEGNGFKLNDKSQ